MEAIDKPKPKLQKAYDKLTKLGVQATISQFEEKIKDKVAAQVIYEDLNKAYKGLPDFATFHNEILVELAPEKEEKSFLDAQVESIKNAKLDNVEAQEADPYFGNVKLQDATEDSNVGEQNEASIFDKLAGIGGNVVENPYQSQGQGQVYKDMVQERQNEAVLQGQKEDVIKTSIKQIEQEYFKPEEFKLSEELPIKKEQTTQKIPTGEFFEKIALQDAEGVKDIEDKYSYTDDATERSYQLQLKGLDMYSQYIEKEGFELEKKQANLNYLRQGQSELNKMQSNLTKQINDFDLKYKNYQDNPTSELQVSLKEQAKYINALQANYQTKAETYNVELQKQNNALTETDEEFKAFNEKAAYLDDYSKMFLDNFQEEKQKQKEAELFQTGIDAFSKIGGINNVFSTEIGTSQYFAKTFANTVIVPTLKGIVNLPTTVKNALGGTYNALDAFSDSFSSYVDNAVKYAYPSPTKLQRNLLNNLADIEVDGTKYQIEFDEKGNISGVRDTDGYSIDKATQAKVIGKFNESEVKPDIRKGNFADISAENLIDKTAQAITATIAVVGGAGYLSNGFKALGISQKISNFAGLTTAGFTIQYNDLRQIAKDSGLNETEASRYGLGMGLALGMLENISPNRIVFKPENILAATKSYAKMIIKGVDSGTAIKQSLKEIAKEVSEENIQAVTEIFATSLGNSATNILTGSNMKEGTSLQEVTEALILTNIATLPIATMGAKTIRGSQNALEKSALYSSAKDWQKFEPILQQALAENKISQTRFDALSATIPILAKKLESLPPTLSEGQKQEMVNLMAEKIHYESIANNPDAIEQVQEQAKEQLARINEDIKKVFELKTMDGETSTYTPSYTQTSPEQISAREKVVQETEQETEESTATTTTEASETVTIKPKETILQETTEIPETEIMQEVTEVQNPAQTQETIVVPEKQGAGEVLATAIESELPPELIERPDRMRIETPTIVEDTNQETRLEEYATNTANVLDFVAKVSKENLAEEVEGATLLIANQYKDLVEQSQPDYKDELIKRYLSVWKIKNTDYKKYAGKANTLGRGNTKFLKYFSTTGMPIDRLAMEINATEKIDNEARQVTPQDLIDFIENEEKGFLDNAFQEDIIRLKAEYKRLTGRELDTKEAEAIQEKNQKEAINIDRHISRMTEQELQELFFKFPELIGILEKYTNESGNLDEDAVFEIGSLLGTEKIKQILNTLKYDKKTTKKVANNFNKKTNERKTDKSTETKQAVQAELGEPEKVVSQDGENGIGTAEIGDGQTEETAEAIENVFSEDDLAELEKEFQNLVDNPEASDEEVIKTVAKVNFDKESADYLAEMEEYGFYAISTESNVTEAIIEEKAGYFAEDNNLTDAQKESLIGYIKSFYNVGNKKNKIDKVNNQEEIYLNGIGLKSKQVQAILNSPFYKKYIAPLFSKRGAIGYGILNPNVYALNRQMQRNINVELAELEYTKRLFQKTIKEIPDDKVEDAILFKKAERLLDIQQDLQESELLYESLNKDLETYKAEIETIKNDRREAIRRKKVPSVVAKMVARILATNPVFNTNEAKIKKLRQEVRLVKYNNARIRNNKILKEMEEIATTTTGFTKRAGQSTKSWLLNAPTRTNRYIQLVADYYKNDLLVQEKNAKAKQIVKLSKENDTISKKIEADIMADADKVIAEAKANYQTARQNMSKAEAQIKKLEITIQSSTTILNESLIGIAEAQKIFDSPATQKSRLMRELQDYLIGKSNTLSFAKLQPIADKMRLNVDTLSQNIIDNDIASDKNTETIKQNIGRYLTRSYKIYDVEGYADKVRKTNPGLVRNAYLFIEAQLKQKGERMQRQADNAKDPARALKIEKQAQQYLNPSEDLVNAYINMALNPASGIPEAVVKGSKVGSKDLSILKTRGDIALVIRQLMGEYTEPFINYSKSIVKMVNLIEKHKFLMQVKENGIKEGYLKEAPEAEYYENIGTSDATDPLNKVYMTAEMKDIMANFSKNEDISKSTNLTVQALGWFIKATNKVNVATTVFSHTTHLINMIGNVSYLTLNGYLDFRQIRKLGIAFSQNTTASQDYYKELLRYGIAKEGLDASTFKEVMNVYKDYTLENILDEQTKKYSRMKNYLTADLPNKIIKLYEKEDLILKILAWENEKARYVKIYRKEFPTFSPAEILELAKTQAANVIKQVTPNYSEIPAGIRELSKSPFIAPFISFTYESIRNYVNAINLGIQEIKTPTRRKLGITRISGVLVATALPSAIAYIINNLKNGFDEEKEEKLRTFIPEWSRTNTIVILNQNKGEYRYLDIGRFNAFQYPTKPFEMVFRSGLQGNLDDEAKVQQLTLEIAKEIFAPFLKTEILANKAFELLQNKTINSSKKIYNNYDDAGTKVAKMLFHIIPSFTPKTVKDTEKLYKAIYGIEEGYRKYNLSDEILANLTGARVSALNIESVFHFEIKKIQENLNELQYNRKIADKNKNIKELETIDKNYDKNIKQARKVYEYAISLGAERTKIEMEMKKLGRKKIIQIKKPAK